MKSALTFLWIAAVAVSVTACGGGAGAPATQASPATAAPPPTSDAASAFAVTSADFTDQGALPPSTYANAFGGQCEGENESPELSWSGAPEGTVAYAIKMVDITSGNFVHWTKADIPASVVEVPTGGADALAGVGGHTGNTEGTYFGPCPPSPDHTYVFTVYALDATLGLEPDFGVGDLNKGLEAHTLAEASIVGTGGPQR